MEIPYTIPISTHKLFNATYMYFFSISLNVNEQKGKLMHNRSINSFHKNDNFATISFQGKEDFTILFVFKEMRNYDTFNKKTNHMHTSINRSFMNEDFKTIQLSKEKTILQHFISLKINRPKN